MSFRPLSAASLAAAALLSSVGSAGQGAERSFPLEVRTFDALEREMTLAPRAGAVQELQNHGQLTFVGVPLPDGRMVDLELARYHTERMQMNVLVNGEPFAGAHDHLGLSVWMGTVAGEAGSEIALSFSEYGSRGWIKSGGALFHLMAAPSAEGDWSKGTSQFVDEATLIARGLEPKAYCGVDELPKPDGGLPPTPVPLPPGGQIAISNTLLELPIAMELDYHMYTLFNQDLSAEMAYVTSLLAWVGFRYEEQIQTLITYPHLQYWTVVNDPWVTPDDSYNNNCVDLLYEVQAAWQYGVPGGALLGHVISGAPLGCGVAWRPGVCNDPYNFSVSSHMNGNVQFPVQQQPDNWDFMVVAHELGHNLDAPHTHDYCPPLDECAPSGYFGQCQTQEVCTNQGTLMSYCHLCSGAYSNITTYFHPQSVIDMRNWVEGNCLPVYCADPVTYCTGKVNSQGCTPAIDASGHPTLGGLDDFHVTATNVVNNKNGLIFWGFTQSSTPFQGGTKCVAAPTARTPVQLSGGNPPPDDCSGSYDFHFTHAYMQARGWAAGTTVYAQAWGRDPQSPITTSLSDAIGITVCN
jgi:hypothetical protein